MSPLHLGTKIGTFSLCRHNGDISYIYVKFVNIFVFQLFPIRMFTVWKLAVSLLYVYWGVSPSVSPVEFAMVLCDITDVSGLSFWLVHVAI